MEQRAARTRICDMADSADATFRKPLRLWPGVLIVALQWVLRFVVPYFLPDALVYGIFGGIAGGLAVAVWWVFFSRTTRLERWGGLVLMVAALLWTPVVIDKSIASGMMGFMFAMYAIPTLSLMLVAGAVLSRNLPGTPRRLALAAAILVGCSGWALLRTNGISGDAASDFAWRWSKTSEQKLVTQAPLPQAAAVAVVPVVKPLAAPEAKPQESAAEASVASESVATVAPPRPLANWPGFRGPGRDGSVTGTRIKTDWAVSPPVQLWRRAVGPGWSSFAVQGDLFYTQEQRGEDEIVACYNATTGVPVWAHHNAARFWESNAGAGPRGTPTLSNGRVYAFGATGILNALNAVDGRVLWTRHPAAETSTKMPGWGFASSPLVVDDLVIVAAAGQLVAYDAASGAPRWAGPADGGDGYSSPELVTLSGVPQVVLLSATGAMSVSPVDGKLLWKHAWPSDTRIMQPAVTPDGDLLLTSGDAMGGVGMRRISVVHGADGWATQERWTSSGLKSSFNDFVVYDGHVFGFDGSILACINAKDGKRSWKGGRYGHGQFVLLRDQGVLLVLSEEGELALVKAATDQYTELARFPALEGKTWNHPVVTGDRLLVRNGTEMAAFRLPSESSGR